MNYKFKSLLFLITTCLTSVATMAQTTLWQTTTQTTPYRIPAIATAKNGDIIAIADYRIDTRDIGNGEVDMYARISTDNGANWSVATCIADGTGNSGFGCGFGDAAVVADRERNEVLVMCVSGKQVFADGTASNHNHMARIRGKYNETTKAWDWSEPDDVTSLFLNDAKALLPNAYTMFIASGRMLQSSYKAEGKDYYRVYAALLVKDSSSSSYKNYVIYSDDFGETWSLLGGVAVTGADEAKVEELPNGNILISSRTKGGRIYNEYTGSWNTSNQKTYTFASGAEAANGELMLYKGLYKVGETTGQTYDVLLQSLPTADNRGGVTVFYQQVDKNSNLSTLTASEAWKSGKVVDSGASCYSTMTIQADGKVGFLYEDNYGVKKPFLQANYDWADIVYIPYDIETLTNNVYTTQAPETSDPVAPTFTLSTTTAELTVGETLQLQYTSNSEGTVTYASSNTAVATVDANSGKVTAVGKGTATITATQVADGNYTAATATCTITVNPANPSFTLSTTTAELTVGETLQLSLTNTSDGTVTYTSGNTAVATVDANGVVTAVAEGTATIKASVTATNKYNAAEATCTITVKAAAVEPDPEEPETPDTPELTTITVTAKSGKIGSSTYYVATFSHEKPMTVPNGVKAYYVKAAGSDEVTLTRVTSGKAIPAGQGVILISTSTGTFVMTESDGTNVADLTDNLLKATLNNGTMTFTANDYVLAVKGSGDWKGYFAFCKTAAGTVVENYANRAYLQLSTSEANIRMRFDDDATGIGSIENDADKTPVYYDLMGRRVDNPTKGIYIVNGKKVLVR